MSRYFPGREGNQSGLFDVNKQAQKSSDKVGQVHPPAWLLREQGVSQTLLWGMKMKAWKEMEQRGSRGDLCKGTETDCSQRLEAMDTS